MNRELYVIASPIGNINDASIHMLETLEKIEYLFCEDTRVTSKLLALLKIKNKPKLISYHKFNETKNLKLAIELINKFNCGIISDAGYPCISDPGHILINECHKLKIKINIVDGPSAIMHAIVQSGLCSKGFLFIGFLPREAKEIIGLLNDLKDKTLPIVFFESVHRLNQTISIIKKEFNNSQIYIGRELSKKFEEYLVEEIKNIKDIKEKGEFTLVIKIKNENIQNNIKYENELKELVKHNMRLKDACKYIAQKYKNVSANALYEKFQTKLNKK